MDRCRAAAGRMSERCSPARCPAVGCRRPERGWMFARRGGKRAQARRDEEWRRLVRSITDPDSDPSEAEEARFRAYLGDLGARPGRRRPRWMTSAAEVAEDLRLDRERG